MRKTMCALLAMLLILCSSYIIGGILFFLAKSPVMVYISLFFYAQGMGSTFSFCLLFFAQLGRNPQETAAISGIAQCGGYVISSVGPVLMGALADLTGAWTWPVVFLLIILGCASVIRRNDMQLFRGSHHLTDELVSPYSRLTGRRGQVPSSTSIWA